MKYKAGKNWTGLKEFESDKEIFKKLAEQGHLKKIEPKVSSRKKKVVEPEKNK